jgi:hypothetical protein
MALVLGAVVPAVSAEDRHAGYYYPPPMSEEVYKARARTLPEANRSMRIRFVTGVTQQLQTRPFPPTAAMFAKGAEAEKLIIVALEDGRIDTIYRARALFANLTGRGALHLLRLRQDAGLQPDHHLQRPRLHPPGRSGVRGR